MIKKGGFEDAVVLWGLQGLSSANCKLDNLIARILAPQRNTICEGPRCL